MGQPIFGDADTQHPTGDRQRLVHGYRVTKPRQIQGTGQAGRPGAHNGNPLVRLWTFFVTILQLPLATCPLLQCPIRHEALQSHDVERRIHFAPRARILAAVVAHATTYRWEGIVPFDATVRRPIVAGADESDVTLGALANGAGVATRCGACLVNGIRRGHAASIDRSVPRVAGSRTGV